MTRGTRVGRTASAAIWLAGLAAFGWAVAVSVTGGFVLTVTGVAISSHRIVPPYLLGAALLFASPSARAFLRSFSNSTGSPRAPGALGIATAVVTFVAALLFGTFTAVGDAFGYISQADLWLKAQLFQSQGPALAMSWSDAAWAFCPLGFRPGIVSGTMVPTYAPGLPLLMAVFKTVIGENGVYFVVPLAGALAVYLTYRLGLQAYDRTTGLVAAALVAASPIFLLQLVQPMSDVPVTACLLLAIVAACDVTWKGAVGAGLASSIAFLIRPNLAPLALPLAVWVVSWPAACRLRGRSARLLMFAAALAPLCLLVAWIQEILYGSPLSSGYGRASDIYALSNLGPNLARYPRWLIQTHTPFVLVALLAPFLPRLTGDRRDPAGARRGRFAWLAAAFVVSVFLCYAFYVPFEHWSALRFVLPAVPLVTVLAAGASIALLRRWQAAWAPAAIALGVMLLVLLDLQAAVRGDVFALRARYQANFIEASRAIRERAPRDAAFIGLVQTSNLSYYAGRQTIRYDLIAPGQFDRAIADLRRAGYKPYLTLMRDEESDFRARFSGSSRVGAWRCGPRATYGEQGAVLVYDLADCQ